MDQVRSSVCADEVGADPPSTQYGSDVLMQSDGYDNVSDLNEKEDNVAMYVRQSPTRSTLSLTLHTA